MTGPLVSLTTDFGLRDPSAAICRGVVLSIAPEARVIDISHEVRKFAIRDGGLLLWCALPYLPVGAHVAVVDPGVGTERLGIGIRVGRGDVLVGPDNGLLMAAAGRLGGIVAVHALEEPAYHLSPVSASFHGRDVFAPAAAHLALGVPLERFGPAIEPSRLVQSPIADPVVGDGVLESSVVYVDTFGNVKLAGLVADLAAALGPLEDGRPLRLLTPDGRIIAEAPWARTFARVPAGAPLVYEDSYGRICLAVNQGDAATRFSLRDDDPVRIVRA